MTAACLAVVATLTVQACGSQTDDQTDIHGNATAAPAEIFTALGQPVEKLSFAASIEHLADALPATGTDLGRDLEGVLVGRVIDATEGAARTPPGHRGRGGPDGVSVDWDADDVAWRDATVTVEVEHLWSAVIPRDTATLQLKIPVAGDLSFPAMPQEDATAFLGELTTVKAFEQAAQTG